MRSASPKKRPSAEQIVSQLERLEKSTHWPLFVLGLGLITVLAGFLFFPFRNEGPPSKELRFGPITRYQTGHDVTVAQLSPDGDRIAYATVDGGLLLRNNRSSSVQEVAPPPGLSIRQLFFTADGGLLAAGLLNGVLETWMVPLNGGAASRLRTDTQLVALSHDGKRLAWLNERHEVWTGSLEGTDARLLYRSRPHEKIAMIFWSAKDKSVWFNRLRGCLTGFSERDVFVNPDTCAESDLAACALDGEGPAVRIKDIRLNSGFFTDDGEFLFLREDVPRRSDAHNLWTVQTNEETGTLAGAPRQLSHLNAVVVSQLTGSRDGRTLAVVRTDSTTQTDVADWQTRPPPLLSHQRRLTLEQTNSYPHAWTLDNQSVIFESDRNGHLELFRQKLTQREAKLLVSTPGDVYMPQVTPDGKWLLMMSSNLPHPGRPPNPTPRRLLRAPIGGGEAVEVSLGEPLDEFRCSLPGRGTGCVLRTTNDNEQRYFELDPIAGKGRELGRTGFVSPGLGRWSLSAGGTRITIPDIHRAGRFLEMRLDPNPSHRSESWRQIGGIGLINSISFVPSGNGWLLNSPILDPIVNLAILPSFLGDLFRSEGLFYVDARLHPHLVYQSSTNTFGVVSPDEKHMAVLGADVTSNVWSFGRASRR